MTDLEIARQASPQPIMEVARAAGIPESAIELYGRIKAKVDVSQLPTDLRGSLVLVTAVSPTPAGEGKTTTSIGLVDALRALGKSATLCLREPSMGPVFGIKGGAAGGGYAQVIPMEEINLAFTGDFAAIAAAHNLLAAMVDNHIHQGNELEIDTRHVWWRRVVDMNDRALRSTIAGLGGAINGVPREDGFDIVAASEVMAIITLASDLHDLRRRLGAIVVGLNRAGEPVTAEQLQAAGAMAVILKDVIKPNLVQTLEGSPAYVHGGPFANIAHGCSSLIATKAALSTSDIVVTEAGFGADLGAEKFYDIACRTGGLVPSVVVVVATVRSMKYNGGVAVADLNQPNPGAVRDGSANLVRHVNNLRQVFGADVIVALNRFATDTDAEIEMVQQCVQAPVVPCTHFVDGGAGATELASTVAQHAAVQTDGIRYAYELDDTYEQKAEQVARQIYHADEVTWSGEARRRLRTIEDAGFSGLPICVAKTQYSFSTDAKALGAPTGHTIHVRDVRLSAGAGFVVLIAGAIMTMPGLPKHPAAMDMDITVDGQIVGLS